MTTGAERETAFDPSKHFVSQCGYMSGPIYACTCGRTMMYHTEALLHAQGIDPVPPAAPVAQPGTEDAESDERFVERMEDELPIDYEHVLYREGDKDRLIALAKRGLTGDRS